MQEARAVGVEDADVAASTVIHTGTGADAMPRLAADRLTLEVGAYLLLWLLAAGLRLWDLGTPLLSADEGRRALAALQLTRGDVSSLAAGPVLMYGTAALFFLFSASDFTARLLPSLAGLAVVFYPYLGRRWFGREAALGATLLLAISPSLVGASRQLDGELPALALLGGAALAYAQAREGGGRLAFALAGLLAGLTLACGPSSFALVVPLGLAFGLTQALAGRLPADSSQLLGRWRPWALPGALGLLLVATGLLSQPQGVQTGVIDPLALWLGSFAGGVRVWPAVVATLAVYEPAVVLGAVAALVLLPWLGAGARFALVWGTVAVLAAGFAAGPGASGLSYIVLPWALAGGTAVAELWRQGRRRLAPAEAALFLCSTLPAVWLFGITAGYVALPNSTVPPSVVLVPPALLWVVAALWAFWRGPSPAAWGAALLAAVVVLGFALHVSAAVAETDPLGPGFLPAHQTTGADLRSLYQEIERESAVLSTPGSRDLSLAVDATLKYPLAWYLRDYTRVTYDGPTVGSTLVVVPAEVEPPPGNYVWQKYTLGGAAAFAASGPGQLWRWLLYREFTVVAPRQEVRLYVAVGNANR